MEAFEIELDDIDSFYIFEEKVSVYDITVEDNNNFLLHNIDKPIVVHNSGKSYTVAIAMVLKTYSKYGHRILYLRQTMSSSEDSTIADIRQAIRDLGLEDDFRERAGVITNKKTKSTISFKGIRSSGSQTAKLKSLSGITTLVIEEAEEVESFEEFSKIDESIRILGKPLKIILIYNPTSAVQSWLHKEWFKEGLPRSDRETLDTVYIHSTYLDNIENLNPSVVKRYEYLKEEDPIYYKNTILAEWTLEVSGRIYNGWEIVDSFEERNDVWYGLDFGYGGKDRTACIEINYVAGKYYVREMFSIPSSKTIDDIANAMKDSGVPYGANIYADSAMPLLIEEVRRRGWGSIRKCTKGNVEAGIKKVQNKTICLLGGEEKNKHLYYAYMTFKHEPNGKLPHEPDELAALRYGINSRTPIENKRTYSSRPKPKIQGYL